MTRTLTIQVPQQPDVVTVGVQPAQAKIQKIVLPTIMLTITPPPTIRARKPIIHGINFPTIQRAPGVGIAPIPVTAAEGIGSSSLVAITSSGAIRACAAIGNDYPAEGFVIAAALVGTTALVRYVGLLEGLAGLTEGTTYYLGLVPGQITTIPEQAGMAFSQAIGVAISTHAILINIQPPVFLA